MRLPLLHTVSAKRTWAYYKHFQRWIGSGLYRPVSYCRNIRASVGVCRKQHKMIISVFSIMSPC